MSTPIPVLLRGDAGPAIGVGHAMRLLAVAEALMERGAACHLASAELPPPLEERMRAAGLHVHRIAAEPGSGADLALTLAVARERAVRAAVVDSYRLPSAWRAGLEAEGQPVVALDDLNDQGPLHARVVVNAAPGAGSLGYERTAPGARLLLGPAFAPLRREIREAAAAPAAPADERRALLLTFGGSDPLRLTGPCLERIAPHLEEGERLLVVLGAASSCGDAVAAVAAAMPDRVELHQDVREMGRLMMRARLAVTAAGTTTAELAALGVPALAVVVATNQVESACQSGALGLMRVVDGRGAGAPDRIAEAALALWRDRAACRTIADRVRGVVDSQGAVRIASAILDAVKGSG